MSNDKLIFKFKQFDVNQAGCAMKINTDGVLLAATATSKQPKHILDIGTGTGVIALMLAQRFNEADIDAVEIDFQASEAAAGNAKNSKFASKITVHNTAFEDFQTDKIFDLIVSNPPFFVNDLRSGEDRKGIARHTSNSFFSTLISKSASILAETGSLWLILPLAQAEKVVKMGLDIGLILSERVYIHSDESKPPFRVMLSLGKQKLDLIERHFYIYESFKCHTKDYNLLLSDFFLKLE